MFKIDEPPRLPEPNNPTPPYPCTGCGICCKMVGIWVKTARSYPRQYLIQNPETKEVADFPHAIDSKGVCSQLNPDNSCKVYGNRPDICSIKRTWEKYHQKEISEHDYYLMAEATCNAMILAAGLDEKYLVTIK